MMNNTGQDKESRGPAASWRNQLTCVSSSYTSTKTGGIWTGKFAKSELHPTARIKGRTDVFGNRLASQEPMVKARRVVQRAIAMNPKLAALWRDLTPAAANALIEQVAAGKLMVETMALQGA